jgi:hypothetical protein
MDSVNLVTWEALGKFSIAALVEKYKSCRKVRLLVIFLHSLSCRCSGSTHDLPPNAFHDLLCQMNANLSHVAEGFVAIRESRYVEF